MMRRGNPRPGASEARDDRALALDHLLRTPRIGWLTMKASGIGDTVNSDRRTVRRWGHFADGPRLAPTFVERLTGLPTGRVTDSGELRQNAQITALGNGGLPLQAMTALSMLTA